MIKKHPRILFFIKGSVPTVVDVEAADKCGNNVVFRNAMMVPQTCNTENCAGVAGAVPEAYKDLPNAKKVLADFKTAEKAKLEIQVERLKEKEKLIAKKKELASEASEKIKVAKAKKVEAGKEIAVAKQEASKAQSITWQSGK